MTPTPPSSPDGSALPPRHRPNLGNLAKDTTESDLWAFDDVDPEADGSADAAKKPGPRFIPEPRDLDRAKANSQRESALPPPSTGEERIRVNVNKARSRPQPGPAPSPHKQGNDFDDLDSWDEPEDVEIPIAYRAEPEKAPVSAPQPAVEEKSAPVVAPESVESVKNPPAATAPVIQPVSALFKLDLTKTERIGLVALVAMLLIGGGVFFLNTIYRLPTKPSLFEENRFPVVGKNLTVVSAENYWRAPSAADAVRRNTQLVPVLKLKSTGGPAAVRVFFRDSEGEPVGDTVTRLIQDGKEIEIAATAGFDDIGMHAAYRTGQDKPWTIEILEAPSEDSAGKDFKQLFKMNISAARR